jgi:hypothetical protein
MSGLEDTFAASFNGDDNTSRMAFSAAAPQKRPTQYVFDHAIWNLHQVLIF